MFALAIRKGVDGFEWIIHNDDISTSAGERSVYRRRQTEPPSGSGDLIFIIFPAGHARFRKCAFIPFRIQDRAKIVRVFHSEIQTIRDYDDSLCGVVTENESHKRNGNND